MLRTSRKVTLTDAGIAYAKAARSILEQLADAEHEAAGEFITPRGDLVITAPVHLVHATRGQMPLKMRRFLDFAAPRLRKALGAISS